jgi:hypothetical protein
MGCELVALPDATDRGFAEPVGLGHTPRAPMRRLWRCRVQSRFHHRSDCSLRNARKTSRTRRILLQARQSKRQKPLAPQLSGSPACGGHLQLPKPLPSPLGVPSCV